MEEEANLATFLFWKLSIILTTIQKCRTIVTKEIKKIPLKISERELIKQAKEIIRAIKKDLTELDEKIKKLENVSIREYFEKLRKRCLEELNELEEICSVFKIL